MAKVISHYWGSPTLSGQTCRLITQGLWFLVKQLLTHVLNCSQKSNYLSKMFKVTKEIKQGPDVPVYGGWGASDCLAVLPGINNK